MKTDLISSGYKYIGFCCLLLLLTRCAPELSRYFDSTGYVESFNTHIVNDSLQLHLKTGADLHFFKEKDEIKDLLQQQERHTGGLLAYGKTEVPPHYQVFLWLNPQKTIEANSSREVVLALIKEQKIVVSCSSPDTSPSNAFRNDCKNIFDSIVIGDSYRDNLPSLFDLLKRYGNSPKFYEALNDILSYPAQSRNEEWLQLQMALNYASFLAPNATYDSLLTTFQPPASNDSTGQVIRREALQGTGRVYRKIIGEAGEHKLVMFNENHFFPTHRILLRKLLPQLQKEGFDHLALEALGQNQDSLLNAGQPPSLDTGFYTREQHFAELIRTGQELGFTFVSYENFDSQKERERGQAENLYRKTFGKNESAKVVVLAGMDHILERPTQKGKSWLGHLLHEEYGLDPLTISQSHLNRYRHLANPVALVPGNAFRKHELNSVDWLLLNHLSLKPDNPNYHYRNRFDQTVQVALFPESESGKEINYADMIPYRTRLVKPGDTFSESLAKSPVFQSSLSTNLPDSSFSLIVFDKDGNLVTEQDSVIIQGLREATELPH